MSDEISKALNLSPLDDGNTKPVLTGNNLQPDNNDYEYARGNMYNIIERGNDALDGILDLAQQSQHPRTYEVAAQLIKTLSDTNKDLLELKKRQQDLQAQDPSAKAKTINNNLFVGSTAELQKLIKKANVDVSDDERS